MHFRFRFRFIERVARRLTRSLAIANIPWLWKITYQLCVDHASGSCDNCDLSCRRWRRTRRRRLYMPSSAAALTTVTACSTALVTVCWRSYKLFRMQLLRWRRAHESSTTSLRCSATFIGCQFARGLSTSSPWQYTNAYMDWRQLTWSMTVMQFPLSPASDTFGLYKHTGTLFVPRTTTTLGMRSCAVAGPRIWNSLPAALRTATLSPLTFVRHLKSHLFDWLTAPLSLRTI